MKKNELIAINQKNNLNAKLLLLLNLLVLSLVLD